MWLVSSFTSFLLLLFTVVSGQLLSLGGQQQQQQQQQNTQVYTGPGYGPPPGGYRREYGGYQGYQAQGYYGGGPYRRGRPRRRPRRGGRHGPRRRFDSYDSYDPYDSLY